MAAGEATYPVRSPDSANRNFNSAENFQFPALNTFSGSAERISVPNTPDRPVLAIDWNLDEFVLHVPTDTQVGAGGSPKIEDPRLNPHTPKHFRQEETDSPGSQENVRKCPRGNPSAADDQPTVQLAAEQQCVLLAEAQYAAAAYAGMPYDEDWSTGLGGEDWHDEAEEQTDPQEWLAWRGG